MRIERVHAAAFGPFNDQTLELAPGMTVVHGPNESGKSTWHAALYAGLCGRRRGRGAMRSDAREFRDRHRPWDGDDWRVSTVVALADGRRIELSYDLDGLVDCRAKDLGIGEDLSDQLMYDGTPDGAKLLGLTRQTLLPTICVRQADLLGILDDPSMLQESLQRAAATGGADETCERALNGIKDFRSEHVGREISNSTRPLMASKRAVDAATAELEAARDAHAEYLALARLRDGAQADAHKAVEQLTRARAALLRQTVDDLDARLDEIRGWQAQFPDGAPPQPVAGGELDERVAAALVAWEGRPEAPPVQEGPAAEALEAELLALPDPPEGDVEVAGEIRVALEEWHRSRHTVDLHSEQRPDLAAGTSALLAEVSAAQLRAAAEALETPVPAVDPALRTAVEQARTRTGPPVAALVGAGVAVAAGAGLAVAGQLAAGMVLLVAGVVAAGVLAVRGRGGAPDAGLEARLAVQEAAAEQAQQRRDTATRDVGAWGLPADPTELRRMAREVEDREGGANRLRRWEQDAERHAAELAAAAERLEDLLAERGAAMTEDDLDAAFAAYEQACRDRSRQAAAAARAPELRSRLEDRRQLEQTLAAQARAREEAEAQLGTAAHAAGFGPADQAAAEELVAWLGRWRQERAEAHEQENRRWQAWLRLQARLERDDPDELDSELRRCRQALEALGEVEPLDLGAQDDEAVVKRLEREERDTAVRLAEFEARLTDLAATIPNVAEAEERLEAAQRERERVQRLGATLERSSEFLEAARDRVQRDVAPRLQTAVQRWLPGITDDRYAEVTVNPSTLQVEVRGEGRPWRDASRLSHGTAEQIYLLLRLALAEHLITTSEPAPVILDDPTVQSDSTRTVAILDLLHELSAERQVVVFSQEDEVLAWAQERLTEPQDRLALLSGGLLPT